MTLILLTILILIIYYRIVHEIKELKKFTGKRIYDSEMWLFNSLYSINPNVVLPEETEKKLSDIPAVVVNVGDDGMDEFNGEKDDWH